MPWSRGTSWCVGGVIGDEAWGQCLEHLFCDQPHSELLTNCTSMCTFIMGKGYHRAHKVRQLFGVASPLCVCGV